VRGLSEVAARCDCSSTAWCSLVCACPGGGGVRTAASNISIWSACDLRGCDHVALGPGDNRLVCRTASATAASQPPSCGARARALPSDGASFRAAGASSLADTSADASSFALGHVYSDGVEALWLRRPQQAWCLRAATRDGALVPLPSAAAGGGGLHGCLALPAAPAAVAAASPLEASSELLERCVVGGLVAGGAYTVRLYEGCEAGAAPLFESAALVAGPLGAQCASASDQEVLWSGNYSKSVSECGHSCWGKAKCSSECLAKRGLSNGCAGCWGDVIGCGAWNCWYAPARPYHPPVLPPVHVLLASSAAMPSRPLADERMTASRARLRTRPTASRSVCMGGQSQACKDCGREHCAAPFGQCIGANVPLPDARR
jgi:hypothetical protein